MRVTIGITAYNAQDTIERAVQSALAQDWSDTEILVVDDCSTDQTWSILKKQAETYPGRMRLLQTPKNSGVAIARNMLIEQAAGDYLTFFDDDDVSDPTRVRLQIERIRAAEEKYGRDTLIVCHTARLQVYEGGCKKFISALGEKESSDSIQGEKVARWILTGSPLIAGRGSGATCSQMASTKTYRTLGGFDPNLRRSEDTDFCVRLAQAGGYFVAIDPPLVTQKMTNGSDKGLIIDRDTFLQCLLKHTVFINETSDIDFCIQWINLKYYLMMRAYGQGIFLFLRMVKKFPRLTCRRLYHLIQGQLQVV